MSAQGGSRTHKTTALNRVPIPIRLLGHGAVLKSTAGYTLAFLTQATFVLNGTQAD